MYIVYNEHPRTLVKTIRSIHKKYEDAVKSLKTQVSEYITKYKGSQKVIFINHLDDMKKHPETKYFVKISDEYSNRYSIFEQTVHVDRGWLYNGMNYESSEIMIFSILDIGAVLEELQSDTIVLNNDVDFIKKVSEQKSMAHGTHVKYVEELKDFLIKNKDKFNRD